MPPFNRYFPTGPLVPAPVVSSNVDRLHLLTSTYLCYFKGSLLLSHPPQDSLPLYVYHLSIIYSFYCVYNIKIQRIQHPSPSTTILMTLHLYPHPASSLCIQHPHPHPFNTLHPHPCTTSASTIQASSTSDAGRQHTCIQRPHPTSISIYSIFYLNTQVISCFRPHPHFAPFVYLYKVDVFSSCYTMNSLEIAI